MKMLKIVLFLIVTQVSLMAHTGVGDTSGFIHGFSHPIGGLDHMLAMVAVGLWASQLGGKSLYAVPMAFVGMMLVGGIIAFLNISLPYIETAILTSVIVLGSMIAFGVKANFLISSLIVGSFAIFHGYAHGAEMPVEAGSLAYSAGFVLATSILHIIGILIGLSLAKLQTSNFTRIGGGVIATSGLLLAFA